LPAEFSRPGFGPDSFSHDEMKNTTIVSE
jgi:hypothetical protein